MRAYAEMNKPSTNGVEMSENVPGRPGRGRRPAAEVRAAVLAAAGRILLRDGLQAVTFDRVATEAGASKTTLYKWWPSPGALAAEAYFTRSRRVLDFPDTGDLRADLIAQLRAFVGWLKDEGAEKPVSELVGAAQMDPDLARAWSENYAQPRRELARERLRVAQRQGQLREDADLDVIVDQLWGACYHRLLVLKVPFDESIVERLVDQALNGSAPRRADHPEPATARQRTS
ncbi:TetR/AcrR family transcriptional regulator [Thermomonospora amylolytica]|uniref:TetR/AcrR family transcriptional regulator n=1 Tax=Thermomonospora amylolytica TaxID=1411117 RepID=UPI0018E56B99|nr:TetR/AcrR family transcriptional regulator [Thermomonospora amylolytica]